MYVCKATSNIYIYTYCRLINDTPLLVILVHQRKRHDPVLCTDRQRWWFWGVPWAIDANLKFFSDLLSKTIKIQMVANTRVVSCHYISWTERVFAECPRTLPVIASGNQKPRFALTLPTIQTNLILIETLNLPGRGTAYPVQRETLSGKLRETAMIRLWENQKTTPKPSRFHMNYGNMLHAGMWVSCLLLLWYWICSFREPIAGCFSWSQDAIAVAWMTSYQSPPIPNLVCTWIWMRPGAGCFGEICLFSTYGDLGVRPKW